ncbi:rna exonuclease [Pyrenophora seminiperda CCB06]|uniref:Rna exonuclease n=1 Tax=Pyrenophora seminiperda CCB06 TaxID=1302712 RepID=A0A3M7M7J9_9PLEO|nr:rna exonuclease [Pyrenophora seminiperda CCB06]
MVSSILSPGVQLMLPATGDTHSVLTDLLSQPSPRLCQTTSFNTMSFSNGSQCTLYLPVPIPYKGPLPLPIPYPPGDAYISEFEGLLEPAEVMEKNGYVLQRLTSIDLEGKRRCSRCNQTIQQLTKTLQKTLRFRAENPIPPPPLKTYDPLPTMFIPHQDGCYESKPCTSPCMFHPGSYDKASKRYDCCDSNVSDSVKYCVTAQIHELRKYDPSDLDRMYQFHFTPPVYPGQNRTPRAAVAIDCEMGTARTGDAELIRLSAIDYFTGEVLVNNLVEPDLPMLHLNTRFSGVTFRQLNRDVRSGRCLKGKAGAKEALWKFIGPESIIVGHAVNNDLRALRLIHPRVVDSFLVENKIVRAKRAIEAATAVAEAEREATNKAELQLLEAAVTLGEVGAEGGGISHLTLNDVVVQVATKAPQVEPKKKKQKKPKGSGDLALKTLLKRYLGRDIQMKGNLGHDSMEDAIAARDLVHWMVKRRLDEAV